MRGRERGVMNELTIDQEAEGFVRRTAAALTQPVEGECLLCFVARMLDEIGCDTTLRFATHYRDLRAPRATALEVRLGRMGGYCDCEIFLNGMTLADRLLAYDEAGEPLPWDGLPACVGVRRGSTKGCANWVRQRRYSVW